VSMGANFSFYHLKHQRLDSWDPGIFFASLAAGVLTLVVVSLLTPSEDQSRVAPFYTKMQTPSDRIAPGTSGEGRSADDHEDGKDWNEAVPPETSRWAAENGRQLLLVNLLHPLRGACGVGFFKAYREDLKGLLIGSLLSAGLVIGLWTLLQL
jgi:hypothetical protein